MLDANLLAREVGLGPEVREVAPDSSTLTWCLGGGMAVAAVHMLMAFIGLICGAVGRLGQRGQGWKVCFAVLAALLPGAEAVPSEFASYLSTRSAGGPGPSHRATSARPPVGQPLGAGRITAQAHSSQVHEVGVPLLNVVTVTVPAAPWRPAPSSLRLREGSRSALAKRNSVHDPIKVIQNCPHTPAHAPSPSCGKVPFSSKFKQKALAKSEAARTELLRASGEQRPAWPRW